MKSKLKLCLIWITTPQADMVIAVCEARELTSVDDVGGHFQALVSRCGGADVHEKILVVNKSDLLSQEERRELQIKLDALNCLLVSCQSNQDIPKLVKRIGSKLEGICRNSGAPAPTRERHKFHLTNVAQHLTRFAKLKLRLDVKNTETTCLQLF